MVCALCEPVEIKVLLLYPMEANENLSVKLCEGETSKKQRKSGPRLFALMDFTIGVNQSDDTVGWSTKILSMVNQVLV